MSTPALVAVKTIMVADDTAFVCDRFKTALEQAGHRALTVRSAADLLARVRQGADQLDLVIVDLRLPHGHGVALVKALRSIDALRAPIVVFSGTIASADEVRELARLGIAGYVDEYTAVQHIVLALAPHLFPDHYNRRSSPRVVLGIPVSYRLGNAIASAVTLNISRGGVAVRTTSPHEAGTVLTVRFRLPGGKKEIAGAARVTWVDRSVGMGLQFTALDDETQASIGEFVESHFFTNRKA